jgi:hypothetical protein
MGIKLNRRKFLKVSTRGAALASLAGFNTNLSLIRPAGAQTLPEGDQGKWLHSIIRDFVVNSPLNTLKNTKNERAFEEPLVGFSRGDDSLFESYKDHVGPFHWTPLEIFQQSFPGITVKPGQLTVISWVLPHTIQTKIEHRKAKKLPTERWARARIFGEEVNNELRKYVVECLSKAGFKAVAPILSPLYKMIIMSEKYGFASNWSERHAAYASGLGTFGLCDGLITPKGKAMRVGSVVANIQLPATPRPYDDHRAYCLFYAKGTCGVCISRCPSGALSKKGGHNKNICAAHLQTTSKYVNSTFGFNGYGCGLCQTGVPCESQIPVHSSL